MRLTRSSVGHISKMIFDQMPGHPVAQLHWYRMKYSEDIHKGRLSLRK